MKTLRFGTTLTALGAFHFGIGAFLPPAADAAALLLTPSNVVANIYHAPDFRNEAFTAVTDNNPAAIDGSTFDTYSDFGIGIGSNDFAGLLFVDQVIFDTATITLVEEFSEADGFSATPNVYLLTGPGDPDTTDPAALGSGYNLVGTLTSYTLPDTDGFSGTGTFTFTFTGLPLSSRTGYGFAIGGVPGGGFENFINVGELSATGVVPEPSSFLLVLACLTGVSGIARRRRA